MMHIFFTSILIILFSLLSSLMMSYISLATPIGPWMAPILALICSIISQLFSYFNHQKSILYYATSAGSLGGILCIAIGSCFPTLYFLNPSLFMSHHAHPINFCMIILLISMAAGLYAIVLANLFSYNLIEKQGLSFPIGTLAYTTISAVQRSSHAAYQLIIGFFATFFVGCLQQGVFGLFNAYQYSLTLINHHHIGIFKVPQVLIKADTLPMMWSIGFMSGKSVAFFLLVGALSKIVLIDPCHALLFSHLDAYHFSIAFCSGLIATSSIISFTSLTTLFSNLSVIRKITNKDGLSPFMHTQAFYVISGLASLSLGVFFYYFDFGMLYAFYIIGASCLTTYSMNTIAGKIGLAQLGRFATFVMIPGMLLFGADPLKVTLMATFVEIVGGVATDALFGYKLQLLSGISRNRMIAWQSLGLLVSSISAGVFFWVLITKFGLGSETLFAQRAQARALLINIDSFDVYALIAGSLYSILLKYTRCNPLLVFGGIMMPLSYSLGIIIGGLSSMLVSDQEQWHPLCSGVFSANSLTEFLKILIK